MKHSSTIENYLKALLHLGEGDREVSTNALADQLGTKASSITDMLKKLAKEQLIHYTPYKGATLTDLGRQKALRIVRKHRLWEVFLVEKLAFPWDEVHEIAEQLEHVYSPQLTERLDAFLDFPTTDPHGDPIPDANGANRVAIASAPLSTLKTGDEGILSSLGDSSAPFLQYLDQLHLGLGQKIVVEEVYAYDGSMSIRFSNSQKTISQIVASNLLINKLNQ